MYNQASNIKKALQNKVIEEKIGESEKVSELEKQYKPLVSMLGLQTDQMAGPNDLMSADGKKIIRLSELMDGILQNINVTNQALIAPNPAYIDPIATPGVPPELNIAELAANTLRRLNVVSDNIAGIKGDTTNLNNNLIELNEEIAKGKLDKGNVDKKMEMPNGIYQGETINDDMIDGFFKELENESQNALTGPPLSKFEISLIKKTLLPAFKRYNGLPYNPPILNRLYESLFPDDKRVLDALAKIDASIGELKMGNAVLANKLDEIPEGLSGIMTYLPEQIAREIKISQATSEDLEKSTITEQKLTSIASPKPVIDEWQRLPTKANNYIDLLPTSYAPTGNVDAAYKQIGEAATGYVNITALMDNPPKLIIYDTRGGIDPNIPRDGISVSEGLRNLLLKSQEELVKENKTYEIPPNELQLIRPYFNTKITRNTKSMFIDGRTNEFDFKGKKIFVLSSANNPEIGKLVNPKDLRKTVSSAIASAPTARASPVPVNNASSLSVASPSPSPSPVSPPISVAEAEKLALATGKPTAVAQAGKKGKKGKTPAQQPPIVEYERDKKGNLILDGNSNPIIKGYTPEQQSKLEFDRDKKGNLILDEHGKPKIKGTGIFDTRDEQSFGKMLANGLFGNVWINPQKLGFGILQVHKFKKSGRGSKLSEQFGVELPIAEHPTYRQNVDQDFIDLITKRFNKKRMYSPLSVDTFKTVSKLAGFNPMNIKGRGTKKDIISKGVLPARDDITGKIVKIITDPNELVERLALLTGTIEAGNSNPLLTAELSEIADILFNKKMIDKSQHRKIYEKYLM